MAYDPHIPPYSIRGGLYSVRFDEGNIALLVVGSQVFLIKNQKFTKDPYT